MSERKRRKLKRLSAVCAPSAGDQQVQSTAEPLGKMPFTNTSTQRRVTVLLGRRRLICITPQEKNAAKRKEHKKARKQEQPTASDTDSSSDGEGGAGSGRDGAEGGGGMEERLQRARAAAQAARDILHYHPETRKDLRQVTAEGYLHHAWSESHRYLSR